MSLLDLLSDASAWESFYAYKCGLACPKSFTAELRRFIDEKRYIPVCSAIGRGDPFPVPKKSVISKMGSRKKRTVYTYPPDENTVLKLLTYLMLRKYDSLFCRCLYSFRPGVTAADALRDLLKKRSVTEMYSYKADVHDYFNSIPAERLLPLLRGALGDDPELYRFISSLLLEPNVSENGTLRAESKGIMAGTPVSSFLANLYLSELDRRFYEKGSVYARYSDDIILFARTPEECASLAGEIRSYLSENGLTVNPDKECFAAPGDGFTFLGFSVKGNTVDIAPATVEKLKGKMRRKRDALARWQKRNGAGGENAARAFIRIFNSKLLESPRDNDLSWSNWFFPVINTSVSLHEIDVYAQDCVRYLISGTHTKARYNVRYRDMKDLGYRSLVNAYYAYRSKRDPGGK